MAFIKDQKWRDIEPLPWWKSPGSYLYVHLNLLIIFNFLGQGYSKLDEDNPGLV